MKITDVTEDRIFKTFGRTYEKKIQPIQSERTSIGKFNFSSVKDW